MAADSEVNQLVNNLDLQHGAKAVIAHNIHTLHIHTTADQPPLAPLDPFASLPPLPANFINRPELSEPLIESLTSHAATVGLTALEGMGGVGKTIAALGLCYEQRIRQTFSDGIVWLTIGRETDISLEFRVKTIAKALNVELRDYSEASYRSLLRDKAALVVLDDVWTLEAVEPFCLPSGRSRLLYTSRNRNLAGALGADSKEIGVLENTQARSFLVRWSGRERKLPPEPYATDILAECKGLVLGLAMIGGALKGQSDSEWVSTLTDLRKARLKQMGLRPGGYAYDTLHASIAVSVEALNSLAKEKYLRLAVLLEDMPAPESLLHALWGGEQDEVHRIARLLVDRCLASRDAEDNIRLHDFQLDYVRGEHRDPDILALLHAALLRSLHVLRRHPDQFTSQMIGRLLAYKASARVGTVLSDLKSFAPRPNLLPLTPALQAAGGPSLRVLEGHSDWVTAVALSADGRRAVSVSKDKTVRVWDLEGREPPRILEGHTDCVLAVALSADGRLAVSGSDDETLRVWDLERSEPARVLEGHFGRITAVALSADGRRAVSGSDDETLRVWDLERSEPARVLEGHFGRITAVALSADGRRAVFGSEDHTLRVWDLKSSEPVRILEGHVGTVNAVALSADGRRAVSCSMDDTLREWDLEGSRPPRALEGHNDYVLAVALSADGQLAVSGSVDRTVRLWELEGSWPPRVLEGHSDFVFAVALSANRRRAISGSRDTTVRVWDLERSQPSGVFEGHPSGITAVALSADGGRAISCSNDCWVREWDLEGSQPPRVLKGQSDGVTAVALSADGRWAVSGSEDKTLQVWDLESSEPARVLDGHFGRVSAVALSADGRRAVSGSEDSALRVWDLKSSEPVRILEGHAGTVDAVALSADGRRAISRSTDKTLLEWDLEGSGRPRMLDNSGLVTAVALSADGRRAVYGCIHRLHVWDLEGGRHRVWEGLDGWISSVALSPDGRRAVSGSADKTVHVWDLATWRILSSFTCDAPVLCCTWTGNTIAVGDKNGQLHLFLWQE